MAKAQSANLLLTDFTRFFGPNGLTLQRLRHFQYGHLESSTPPTALSVHRSQHVRRSHKG
jgi:hypothetical protein